MRAWFKKVLEAGTAHATADSEKRRIRISNGLACLFILTTGTYGPVMHLLGLDHLVLAIVLGTLAYVVVPALNALGATLLSRIFLITNSVAIVAFFSIVLGKESGVYYVFLAFAALAFVVFELKDRLALAFTIGSSLLLLAACEAYYQLGNAAAPLSSQHARYLSYSLFLLAYVIIVAVVYSFYVSNSRAEAAIKAAKDQQDGDYFLTNLIIQPLFKNLNRSETVATKFFVRQKKTFSFKGRMAELGGDMNVTGNLLLRGKRYTMFVNSDAMGKSMQGAGGAIVLGTVVNAILARSAANKRNLNVSPRDWMLDTHAELQKIFEAFDGSMLVSCVLGLISEDGRMYYFNAEHPRTVLYRDGRAVFLPGEVTQHKIGIPLPYDVTISEFDLQPGDVLIVGSDGRDDLALSVGGARQINSDEELFLRHVEESRGDLEKIHASLVRVGELIDDLSLVRVEYNGAASFEQRNPDVKRVRTLMRARRYQEALEELEQDTDDESRERVYYRAVCLERTGLGRAAVALLDRHAELVRDHVPSLLLRAAIADRAGDSDGAESNVDAALKLHPEHPRALRMRSRLRAATNTGAVGPDGADL